MCAPPAPDAGPRICDCRYADHQVPAGRSPAAHMPAAHMPAALNRDGLNRDGLNRDGLNHLGLSRFGRVRDGPSCLDPSCIGRIHGDPVRGDPSLSDPVCDGRTRGWRLRCRLVGIGHPIADRRVGRSSTKACGPLSRSPPRGADCGGRRRREPDRPANPRCHVLGRYDRIRLRVDQHRLSNRCLRGVLLPIAQPRIVRYRNGHRRTDRRQIALQRNARQKDARHSIGCRPTNCRNDCRRIGSRRTDLRRTDRRLGAVPCSHSLPHLCRPRSPTQSRVTRVRRHRERKRTTVDAIEPAPSSRTGLGGARDVARRATS